MKTAPLLLTIVCSFFHSIVAAQCTPAPVLNFTNPSFEGPTNAHQTPGPWSTCMSGQTPDTQPGNWGVAMAPTNGSSYLGLIHQASTGWQEGATQQLASPLVAGTSYSFTIDLANVNNSDPSSGIIPGCAECQIWGGFSPCDKNTLLWSSGNITPYDTWQTHNVAFTPTQTFTYILIQVFSLGCTDGPYILVDNIGPITPSNVTASITLNNNVLCHGGSTGQATVNAVGQNPPFNYQWSTTPVQNGTVISNMPAGSYTVTVTDANTCSATANVVITQPNALVLTPTVINASCLSTGSAYINYAGGTTPMNFLWSNGVTTQNNGNLFAGLYNITVTDGNNCTATASANITQPNTFTVTGNVTQPTCQVGGSISTSITGGAAPFTYAWSTTPAQSGATATNLSSGSYTVSVTDNNGCPGTATFTVNPPPNSFNINLTPQSVSCFGGNNGGITSTLTGGTGPFTYTWGTAPIQNSANAINLTAGTYTVSISDAVGCSATASATVSAPTALSVSNTKTDILCFGMATGSATVTASGGTPNYSYLWSNAGNSASLTNVSAGNLTVTVTDANNCTTTSSLTINQPATPLTVTQSQIDVLCFGASTGSATVLANGGTGAYTYQWNTTPTQTSATATSLSANTYTTTVTDENNCTATITTTINQPTAPVVASVTQSSPLCFGQAVAQATASATGGTGAYTYAWNTTPAQTIATATNLSAGSYTVTINDANNCSSSASTTISPAPSPLVVSLLPTDVLCFGAATGSVAASASGSNGHYTYTWRTTPVQTTATASSLTAGSYTVTVTDVVGCSASAQSNVNQPTAPLALSHTQVDVLCFGAATGSIQLTAAGGTPNYGYLWSNSNNTALLNNLTAGAYTVTTTDANNCTATLSVTIAQPAAPLTASSTLTNLTCFGNNSGSISITNTVGGTPNYTCTWSNSANNTATQTGLAAGSYTVTITDANNCSITLSNLTLTEPTALSATTAKVDVSCPGINDGQVAATVLGGTSPYSYLWNNTGNTSTIQNLATGNYSLTATDANGCSVTASANVIELPGVTASGTAQNVLCYPLQNGAINLSATSSFLPLQYTWSNGSTLEDLQGIASGDYSVTIQDANGCVDSLSFVISNDSAFSISVSPNYSEIDLGETVNLAVSDSTSIASVLWTPSVGLDCSDCLQPTAAPIDNIVYHIHATDINGCEADTRAEIIVTPKYTVFIHNAFTPNGDGKNDDFEVFGNKEAWKQFSVAIFDRLGEKVYESNDMNFQWDGTYKGKMLNPTVLVYMINIVYLNNYTDKLFKGSLTLVR